MPQVITANRLADGTVVYAGRGGGWVERLNEARIFMSKAEADIGLRLAQDDAKGNQILEPGVVEVAEDENGLRAVSLRESIRAQGPTIDFLPRIRAAEDNTSVFREPRWPEVDAEVPVRPRDQDWKKRELLDAAGAAPEIGR